jgi:hypothetical protein
VVCVSVVCVWVVSVGVVSVCVVSVWVVCVVGVVSVCVVWGAWHWLPISESRRSSPSAMPCRTPLSTERGTCPRR